jgi:outer membrane protein OmpA-like peptidoglycan-associated protein
MATVPVQPNRSQKQRVLQAPEKAPASPAHAAASVKASSPSHAHEKVRVSPGVKPSASNQAMQRMVRGRVLQKKLAINRPGDIYEQEADRVADAVMRMPASMPAQEFVRESGLPSRLQCCSCGKPVSSGERCEACKKQGTKLQRSSTTSSPENASAPPIVHDVLNSAGRPLDGATRQFMEPRFGQDFSNVRVHTGSQAAESATAVNALAYTVGNHVVFGRSQYAPATQAGRKLLAHELTHTVQQESQAPAQLSRKCGPQGYGPAPASCNATSITASDSPRGKRFLFNVNCDDFAPGERSKLEALVDPKETPPGSDIEIMGMASADGDAAFNLSLSCHRADAAADVLKGKGLGGSIRSVQAAGAVEGTEHDPTFRAVDVLVKKCEDQQKISQEKDELPPTPAYAPQAVPGKDLPLKLQTIFDQTNRNLFSPPHVPKGVLGFTIPMLPAVFPSVAAPEIAVQAQDVDGSDCKKCVASWDLHRPQVLSFAAQGFIVPESRFWINQDKDRRQCPSSGTFGDKKDVRILITAEAHQKIVQGEKEHFLDAQRTFDLTGGRYLANSLRLTAERTPLRGKSQQECRTKVANFLESLAGSPGVIGIVGTEGFLKGGYTGLFVRSFLDEFQASGKERDDAGKHTAISKPPANRNPIQPNLDTAINPFGCDAFFRKDDKDSFPGIPGDSSENVIKDLDEPSKQTWHHL